MAMLAASAVNAPQSRNARRLGHGRRRVGPEIGKRLRTTIPAGSRETADRLIRAEPGIRNVRGDKRERAWASHPDFRIVKVERIGSSRISTTRQIHRADAIVTASVDQLKVISEREAVVVQRDSVVGLEPACEGIRRAIAAAVDSGNCFAQIVSRIREAARRVESTALGINVDDDGVVMWAAAAGKHAAYRCAIVGKREAAPTQRTAKSCVAVAGVKVRIELAQQRTELRRHSPRKLSLAS